MSRNILFLSHRLPYPPTKGDKIRSYALLKHLSSKGTVHLGCFVDDRSDFAYLDTVRGLVRGECHFEFMGALKKASRGVRALAEGQAITVGCFRSAGLVRFLERLFLQNKFDDVVVFGSAMAPYLFKSEFRPDRVLFDMVDVDSDKWLQYSASSTGLKKWLFRREAQTLLKTERSAAQLFGKTLLVSDFEADTFREIAPESADKIDALTNGVDLAYFSPATFDSPFLPQESPIVMTGHMGYRPNYEGALWFLREILPLIKERIPNVRAYFVGASPPPALRAVASDSVVVTGRVADVRPYLHFAGVVIAPLRIARGVQNKVLEAMAMAKPVVATREATRGLGVRSDVHLWIANAPGRFADAVLSALQGSESLAIMQAGREYVSKNHNWERVLSKLDADLERVRHGQLSDSNEQNLLCLATK
jgi:sugar transferase (PEP-CTERM/EpsH1 system associated)